MEFNELEFLREAVKIDSSESVDEMREFLLDTLEDFDLEPEVDQHGNVLCRRGSGSPGLLLNTHLDTVRPGLDFEETQEKVLGRGSCDAKGPLASILKAFIEADIDGELILAVTPDEETGTRGSYYLDLEFDSCIVGEPTDLRPCHAARGVFKAEIVVEGESAHASEPSQGINAVEEAGKVLSKLKDFDEGRNFDTDLPDPDLSATVIEGGEATNQIPARCRITLDRRNVPPEKPQDFIKNLENFLRENVETEARISVRENANTEYFLDAFETDKNSEIVRKLEDYSGSESKIFGAATEASRFRDGDVAVFGPGKLSDEEGGVAHSEREYVEKEKVRKASEIVKGAVEDILD
jgi:acetylornithine deacetylase